jgi:hypothetical protein
LTPEKDDDRCSPFSLCWAAGTTGANAGTTVDGTEGGDFGFDFVISPRVSHIEHLAVRPIYSSGAS